MAPELGGKIRINFSSKMSIRATPGRACIRHNSEKGRPFSELCLMQARPFSQKGFARIFVFNSIGGYKNHMISFTDICHELLQYGTKGHEVLHIQSVGEQKIPVTGPPYTTKKPRNRIRIFLRLKGVGGAYVSGSRDRILAISGVGSITAGCRHGSRAVPPVPGRNCCEAACLGQEMA